jgi:hypothetical protein
MAKKRVKVFCARKSAWWYSEEEKKIYVYGEKGEIIFLSLNIYR